MSLIIHTLFAFLPCFLLLLLGRPSEAATSLPTLQWIQYDSFLDATAVRPPPRSDFAMGYDWRRRFLYIFGGKSASGQPLDDTWVLDILHLTWSRPATAIDQRPPARYGSVFGMDQPKDQSRDSMIVSLGMGAGGLVLQDIWTFDLNHQAWFQVNVTGDGPGPLYSAAGGIDTGNGDQTVQSLVVSGGVREDGTTGAANTVWVCALSGSYVVNSFAGVWSQKTLSLGSSIPTGLTGSASTILSNSRIAYYGGCAGSSIDQCPLGSGGVLTFPDSNPLVASRGNPGWQATSLGCAPPRDDALLGRFTRDYDPNTQEPFRNLAVLFGGRGLPTLGNGPLGSLSLLDTGTGSWFPVQAAGDPATGAFPSLRSGARMLPTSAATTLSAQIAANDIFMFGGQDPTQTGVALNDIWILRAFTTPMTATSPGPPTSPLISVSPTNRSTLMDAANGQGVISTPLACTVVPDDVRRHGIYMTLGCLLLPIAVTFVRFGRPVKRAPLWWRLAWSIPYTLLLAASLALLIYGYTIAYNMIGGSNPPAPYLHLHGAHAIAGVVLLALAWIISPALIILARLVGLLQRRMHKDQARIQEKEEAGHLHGRYDRDNDDDDSFVSDSSYEDATGGGGGGGFQVLNRSPQSPSLATHPSQAPRTSEPGSTARRRSQVERRKSISVLSMLTGQDGSEYWASYYGYPVYGLNPSHPRTIDGRSQYGGRIEEMEGDSLGVRALSHLHHLLAHATLFALHIYVLLRAFPGLGSGWAGAYLGVAIAIYALWAILAWFGAPRQSALSLSLGRWFGGRNKDWVIAHRESKVQDKSANLELSPPPPLPASASPSTKRPTSSLAHYEMVRPPPHLRAGAISEATGEGEDDADTHRRLEEEYNGRDVMVMTIPKRRLAVVNDD